MLHVNFTGESESYDWAHLFSEYCRHIRPDWTVLGRLDRLQLRLWKGFHKRKNFLFAGSDAGGERAAAIYSLLGTAKLNGHNPEAFLREVLTRIADHPINHIADLLPWNLNAAHVTPLTATDTTPDLPSQA